MTKTVYATVHGVEGLGSTKALAKQDAIKRIETAMSGSYDPIIIQSRGNAILVFRMPEGWDTKVIVDTQNGIRDGILYGNGNFQTREEACKAAWSHVAQLSWTAADGICPSVELEPVDRVKFELWANFQLRYQAAKAKGLNDLDAHSYAGKDPFRPELWQE